MDNQKAVFFLIIGGALALVLGLASLGSWLVWRTQQPPPTPIVVATEPPSSFIAESPASSKAVNAPNLETGRTWNGLAIEVVDVKTNGWPWVKAHNQFNDPPLQGRRMVLVTVEVRQIESEDEYTALSESDFTMIGARGEVYTTYGNQSSCGVVPDGLDGVVSHNHWIRGAICIQVPQDERDLTLVYQPSIGDEPAVYLALPLSQ